jgi:hypothetical protein
LVLVMLGVAAMTVPGERLKARWSRR